MINSLIILPLFSNVWAYTHQGQISNASALVYLQRILTATPSLKPDSKFFHCEVDVLVPITFHVVSLVIPCFSSVSPPIFTLFPAIKFNCDSENKLRQNRKKWKNSDWDKLTCRHNSGSLLHWRKFGLLAGVWSLESSSLDHRFVEDTEAVPVSLSTWYMKGEINTC